MKKDMIKYRPLMAKIMISMEIVRAFHFSKVCFVIRYSGYYKGFPCRKQVFLFPPMLIALLIGVGAIPGNTGLIQSGDLR